MFIPSSRATASRLVGTTTRRHQSTMAMTASHNSPATWSGHVSFASPEADFTGHLAQQQRSHTQAVTATAASTSTTTTTPEWTGSLSFSSPEADFTGHKAQQEQVDTTPAWSGNLSFASPEADFTSSPSVEGKPQSFADILPVRPRTKSTSWWSQTMSFASPESDFCSSQYDTQEAPAVVPQTLAEAMESNQAVVVTTVEAPHRIVHVNKAWEDLCGYTQQEVLNKTLRVIQGNDTNTKLAAMKISDLVKEKKPSDMYVINYTKDGQSFKNHVSMGTMKLTEQENNVEFLVGVLQKVNRVPLKMIY